VSRTCLFCFLRRESVLFSPYNIPVLILPYKIIAYFVIRHTEW
jgi:hypothetical protein